MVEAAARLCHEAALRPARARAAPLGPCRGPAPQRSGQSPGRDPRLRLATRCLLRCPEQVSRAALGGRPHASPAPSRLPFIPSNSNNLLRSSPRAPQLKSTQAHCGKRKPRLVLGDWAGFFVLGREVIPAVRRRQLPSSLRLVPQRPPAAHPLPPLTGASTDGYRMVEAVVGGFTTSR